MDAGRSHSDIHIVHMAGSALGFTAFRFLEDVWDVVAVTAAAGGGCLRIRGEVRRTVAGDRLDEIAASFISVNDAAAAAADFAASAAAAPAALAAATMVTARVAGRLLVRRRCEGEDISVDCCNVESAKRLAPELEAKE